MPVGVTVSKMDMVRTISVVRELALGKILTLGNGLGIMMGADMSIGSVIDVERRKMVAGLSTMDLCELNDLLNKHGIGHAIPGG